MSWWVHSSPEGLESLQIVWCPLVLLVSLPSVQSVMMLWWIIGRLSRCYVDQQIGPTLSSCNRRRLSELRQSWTTVVELGWNNSRTRVGVAELSAGRVAWARDAEAMSRLGNYSDFVL